jgi:HAD superfamily hydrolase (TIGR01509 family)
MLKNVIFDLGNVLLSFKPAEFLESRNYKENIRLIMLSDIFGSNKWQMLDRGSITVCEAIDSISSRSSLTRDEIARIFDLRTEIISPLPSNIKILPELKEKGFKLFYLSNFPIDIFDEVRKKYEFFNYFDGGIISASVKYSKPDAEIYKIFLESYSLLPEECLYIDDLEPNVVTSEVMGMNGFFTAGSPDISSEIRKRLNIDL